jgi:PAS domain S-box-containing protein
LPDPSHPPRSRKDPSRRRRTRAVLVVFACIVALQLLVAVISIDVLSAVRAYVTGESLYSKGQKDAQIYLIDYAEFQREEDYERFLGALAAPLSYRQAREELQKPDFDPEVARRGLLGGGTHADDIPGVIRLFRWFQKTPLMADPIATWTAGDQVIAEMVALAQRAHERVAAGDLRASAVSEMRLEAPRLNKRLTELENTFAAQLSDSSRVTARLLLGLNLALALLLGLSGIAFVRHSARVQAATEDEVRRRQESLQRLLDSSAEGLYGVDVEGRCTFINRAALEMLGYSRESELLGRDIHALIHHADAQGRPYPDSSRMMRASRDRLELHAADEVFWRKDGKSFPVEYWLHPVIEDGQLHGAVATFFDISERVHMQEALRQGEVRIEKLVDAVTDGVVTVDAEGRIVLCNRAAERIFGVPAGKAIGSPIERFIPYRPQQPYGPRVQKVALEPSGWNGGGVHDLTGLRVDGSEFPLEATLSRLETERGALTTVVLRDVTELHVARAERQAREALEAANRAKTEFLSRMSHELRTPLNAVLGFSQMLRLDRARPPSAEQLKRIQHIESAGAHLLALVNDVLDLSRVEAGQLTVDLQSIDIEAATGEAVAMVLPLASASGIDVHVDRTGDAAPSGFGPTDPVAVVADKTRLRQVLVNLLSNAVKYNRSGGQVVVSWRVRPDGCHVSIADDGPGMTPEKLGRLFEPFNRLGAEKSKVEGTGIGLVLSRRLMELMRGRLDVQSTVGKGTVATMVLETTDVRPAHVPSPAPPSQHGALDTSLRVLYAEDNEVNVELVRQVVGLRPEIALSVAESGAIALAMARRDPPDLMLVDMNLGDMTGIELARHLQQRPATASIRLVALSADALPEQIDAALACGFEGYLTKPVDFRQLLNVLDGLPVT